MVSCDRAAPLGFLRTVYYPSDWIAVLLKTCGTGDVVQRVLPVSAAASMGYQAWLRHQNVKGWNVYVSVNALRPGRSRARDAIAAVRHVFVEADEDGASLLDTIAARPDLPAPSYVLHSSPGRVHVLWRVEGFEGDRVERLQKQLARELHTDPAATSCSQMTRLPRFLNHKYEPPHLIAIEYRNTEATFNPTAFPKMPAPADPWRVSTRTTVLLTTESRNGLTRARKYLRRAAPAIAGQHGDVRTFRVCCHMVRGFALTDDEALSVLAEWNARCQPPWSETELRAKLAHARRYGRDDIGALLNR